MQLSSSIGIKPFALPVQGLPAPTQPSSSAFGGYKMQATTVVDLEPKNVEAPAAAATAK